MMRLIPLTLMVACGPDPTTALPPAGVVCAALTEGALPPNTVVEGDQVDTQPLAKGVDWSAAGWWGDVPCGELFSGVVVQWTPPASGGAFTLSAQARHADRGRAEGLRFPVIALWTDGTSCDCAADERGRVDAAVDLAPGDALHLLVGLESTADRRHHLEPNAGFSVPYRVQIIPENPL